MVILIVLSRPRAKVVDGRGVTVRRLRQEKSRISDIFSNLHLWRCAPEVREVSNQVHTVGVDGAIKSVRRCGQLRSSRWGTEGHGLGFCLLAPGSQR
jgi:hypothetical protein